MFGVWIRVGGGKRGASMRYLILLMFVFGSIGCAMETSNDVPSGGADVKWAIVIHGGAGAIGRDADPADIAEYEASLKEALEAGRAVLAGGGVGLDAVEAAIRVMENNPRFNAGKGAVMTGEGGHELDASIMDGQTKAAGAVAGVKTIKNPIGLARLVMTETRHVLLGGTGADDFGAAMGVEQVDQAYFFTERRKGQLDRAKARDQVSLDHGGNVGGEIAKTSDVDSKRENSGADFDEDKYGTVGCVVLDVFGNLAAGTSTGGLTNKKHGRIGDSPIVGAGTYADNATCAVSGTGIGEEFIRHGVAFQISAIMEHKHVSLAEAARIVIQEKLKKGDGGIIAVDGAGNIVMEYNSLGMYRGAADSGGRFEVKIWD